MPVFETFVLFTQKMYFHIEHFVAALPKWQLDFPETVDTSSGLPLDGANHQPLPQVPPMEHSD